MSAESIDRQAAGWAERIRGARLSDEEYDQFSAWLAASPENAEAFEGQQLLAGLVRDLRASATDVDRARWRVRGRSKALIASRWVPRSLPSVAAAAAVVAVVAVLTLTIFLRHRPGTQIFVTAAGQQREVHLDDGSVAYLNTRTTIRSHSDAHQRTVDLLDGEVLFSVRTDASRPFVVNVASTRIRVVGTRFNVLRRADNVRLSVLAGTVDVAGPGPDAAHEWHRQLHANEEVTYQSTGILAELQGPAVGKRTLWTSQTIEVENKTLPDVVAELERYTDALIIIADSNLEDKRVVATLDVRSVPAALDKLQSLAPIRVERSGNSFVLHYRPDPRETTATTNEAR